MNTSHEHHSFVVGHAGALVTARRPGTAGLAAPNRSGLAACTFARRDTPTSSADSARAGRAVGVGVAESVGDGVWLGVGVVDGVRVADAVAAADSVLAAESSAEAEPVRE